METNYLIVARSFVAISPNNPIETPQRGQLGIVRMDDGITPFLTTDKRGADTYADWMRAHFGNEATYEVIAIGVNI
jgi:hypothetical protein